MDRVRLWSVSQSNNLDEIGVAHANSGQSSSPDANPNATPIPNATPNLNPNAKPDASSNARPDRQKEVK